MDNTPYVSESYKFDSEIYAVLFFVLPEAIDGRADV